MSGTWGRQASDWEVSPEAEHQERDGQYGGSVRA